MITRIRFVYKISRPRFWGYLAGPYAIGYIIGVPAQTDLLESFFVLHLIYFLFFANILLYGINDYFDMDTDQFNKKKSEHEHRLMLYERRTLGSILVFSVLISIGMIFLQTSITAVFLLLAFLLLSVFYSAPPLRFKARPFFDSTSNILYAIPAFLAFYQVTGQLVSFPVFLGAFCWTAAMHLFSAIPDIIPDKKAGIVTTAVFLKQKTSLVLCTGLWTVSAVVALTSPPLFPWSFFALIYPAIPLYILSNQQRIEGVYWKFPYVTMALGMILFFIFYLSKPYVSN